MDTARTLNKILHDDIDTILAALGRVRRWRGGRGETFYSELEGGLGSQHSSSFGSPSLAR